MHTIASLTPLKDSDIAQVIEKTEFAPGLLNVNQQVAFILTQSWCWQWVEMHGWLKSLASNAQSESSCSVYYYEYDKSDLFDPFRNFKERQWNNHEVPYIRYYHHTNLIAESNYVKQEQFFSYFKL